MRYADIWEYTGYELIIRQRLILVLLIKTRSYFYIAIYSEFELPASICRQKMVCSIKDYIQSQCINNAFVTLTTGTYVPGPVVVK